MTFFASTSSKRLLLLVALAAAGCVRGKAPEPTAVPPAPADLKIGMWATVTVRNGKIDELAANL